jgi:hypothetical protein
MPGKSGVASRPPTARMKRRARMTASPAATVLEVRKRARAERTLIPSAARWSAERPAAAAFDAWVMWSRTLARFTWSGAPVTPSDGARRRVSFTEAEAISAASGTAPEVRFAPPSVFFSTSTTEAPARTADRAAAMPPGPPPTTQMSGVRVTAIG